MPPQSSVVRGTDGRTERSTIFWVLELSVGSHVAERPLLEVVTVVSHAVLIFWNVVACPPRGLPNEFGAGARGAIKLFNMFYF